MSDEEEEYDEEEEEEEEEDGDEEEEEGVDQEAVKTALVKEDIAMLMDVFGYIDRTSKRLASRLDNESLSSNRGAGGGGNKAAHNNILRSTVGAPMNKNGDAGAGDHDSDEEQHELSGGWSQYEHMGDAERGLLLEKAILALGINDNASQLNDRRQYEADGNADSEERRPNSRSRGR